MDKRLEILTNEEMGAADRRAVQLGVPSLTLMENAGCAVADEAERMVAPGAEVVVLCGPGNNGGDGFVAARLLRERGYRVRVALLGSPAALKGDASEMAARWAGEVEPAERLELGRDGLVIDALFGAGLARPLAGPAAELVEAVNAAARPVLSVDVPSGLDGTTGTPRGAAVQAALTVTFFRRKPAHVLLPGRLLCGRVVVADIGIPDAVLSTPLGADAGGVPRSLSIVTHVNGPGLWIGTYPWPALGGHKYSRGHAVVVSGPAEGTGAARLAARGALRAGAGLVTVASPRAAFPVNAAHLTAIMVKPFEVPRGLAEIVADARKNVVVIGPGCGVGGETRQMVEIVLASGAAAVLDADALTSFAVEAGGAQTISFGFTGHTEARRDKAGASALFAAIASRSAPVVMTPHEGELKRLLPELTGSKLERARRAAAASGAIVILKGADTVIAAPDGRAAINDNAPPWLATAGSGDVLTGFVAALLAQGMPAFEAACAAVWLHGESAEQLGPGLIAEDLPELLPTVLRELFAVAHGQA